MTSESVGYGMTQKYSSHTSLHLGLSMSQPINAYMASLACSYTRPNALTCFIFAADRQTLPRSTHGWAHGPWQLVYGLYLFGYCLKTFAMPSLFFFQRLWRFMMDFIADFMKSIQMSEHPHYK